MSTISSSNFLALTDSLGVMYDELLSIQEGSEQSTLDGGADDNVTRILALTDIEQAADLAGGFEDLKARMSQVFRTPSDVFMVVCRALRTHVGNINTYLTANTAKVSRSFADLFRLLFGETSLLPANVFQDTNVVGRTGAITGATAVTNTAGTDLDITKVAPSQYEVRCTVDIAGSSTPTLTLTMKKADGTSEVKTVGPLDDTFDAGDVIDVGTSSDVYIGCTLIAVSGGGASGTIEVRNKLIRTPVI